jgi:hypothetical protein
MIKSHEKQNYTASSTSDRDKNSLNEKNPILSTIHRSLQLTQPKEMLKN